MNRTSVGGLPRSLSEMETDSGSTTTAAAKSMASIQETSSKKTWGPLEIATTAKRETKTVIAANTNYRNGVSDTESWSNINFSGFLNLRDLNTLLLKYIGVVHELEEGESGGAVTNSVIDIDIDETEVKTLDKKYQDEVEAWKKLYKASNDQREALQAQIKKLEEEKKQLQKKSDENDAKIKEREETIKTLRAKISEIQAKLSEFLFQPDIFEAELNRLHIERVHLIGELNSYKSLGENERMRNLDKDKDKGSLEQELKFKIDLLESELKSKKEKTSIESSSLEVRIKGEFAARLKVELQMLRSMFEEAMRENKGKFELMYRDQITELELKMSLAMSQQMSAADLEIIRTQVKELEASIGSLTVKNQSLAQSWSKLSVELKKMEMKFNKEMGEKELNMMHLKSENARMKKWYEELMAQMMMTKVEVGVYDKLLSPEVKRITARHSEQVSLRDAITMQ